MSEREKLDVKYKCSVCGEVGVGPDITWCSVANYEHRYEPEYRVPAHAVPAWPEKQEDLVEFIMGMLREAEDEGFERGQRSAERLQRLRELKAARASKDSS